jgi:Glutamyl-tRNAGlu reductase, dimerisation domain
MEKRKTCLPEMPDVVPTIALLQDHLETIHQAEVDRLRGRWAISPSSRRWQLKRLPGIMSNIINTPIDILKTAA